MDWNYFDRFEEITDKYLPRVGEGETMATQAVTAISKLVYKWYNDGDVYDNSYAMSGWCNDLSSYANWLAKYLDGALDILADIKGCCTDSAYELILAKLANKYLKADVLAELNKKPKCDSIYTATYVFEFIEESEEDDEYYY